MFKTTHAVYIIRFSFLFWSLIASIFIGYQYILIGFIFSMFCIDSKIRTKNSPREIKDHSVNSIVFIFLAIFFVSIPLIFSSLKETFSSEQVEKFIDNANLNVGKGRTIIELIMNSVTIIPFLIIDSMNRYSMKKRIMIFLPILFFLIYQAGSSRGLLSIFLLSIFIPRINKARGLIMFSSFFLLLYTGVTFYRDGINENFLLPIFDSFAFPAYNLSLLANKGLTLNVVDYIVQIFQKLIPSFLFEKNIYSFNIEMTKTIYPFMRDRVSSISVFTYLGDFLVYRPIIIMIVFNLFILRLLSAYVFRIIFKYNLKSTSLFIALFYITLLRSRISDLISYLILYLLILMLFDLLNRVRTNYSSENRTS